MRRLLMLVLVLVVAGCGGSKSSSGNGSTVKLASSSLGRILVDDKGRTLYLFEADTNGKSTCSGPCAATWPPYNVGTKQVVYHGHPLYYYVGDNKTPGSMKGEDLNTFGGKWFVVDGSGKAVAPAGSGSEMGGGGGGGGYGY
jgi:predicted lipoprotein with Yx(FWY)xxD motif